MIEKGSYLRIFKWPKHWMALLFCAQDALGIALSCLEQAGARSARWLQAPGISPGARSLCQLYELEQRWTILGHAKLLRLGNGN